MNKKKFLLGFLVLLTAAVIIGGAQYSRIVQAEKMTKSEQKVDRTKTTKKLVESLFKNEKKQELANNVTEKEIKNILKQVKDLSTSLANEKLLQDVNTASLFYRTQEEVRSLLIDKILSDNVVEQQLEEAKKSLKKLEPLSLTLFKELSEMLAEATVQFKYNEETTKALTVLFEDTDKKIVRDNVTREQVEQVQKKVSMIKNKKIKKEQEERLKLIEEQLIEKEEKMLKEKELEENLLEEEKLKEEAEQDLQNNAEKDEVERNSNTTYEESVNTWKPESSKPTKPWKPSGNKNPIPEVKPNPKPVQEPDQSLNPKPETEPEVKPVPVPKPDENPDNEPEASKEPEPIPDSSTGSDNFLN